MREVRVFGVGQALSVLIDFGDYRFGIVDCGQTGSDEPSLLLDHLSSMINGGASVRVLFLAVTHLHWDHVSRMEELLTTYVSVAERVERFVCNGVVIGVFGRRLRLDPNSARGVIGRFGSVTHRHLTSLAACVSLARRMGGVRECEAFVSHRDDYPRDLTPECLRPEGVEVLLYGPLVERIEAMEGLRGESAREMVDDFLLRSGKRAGDWNSTSLLLAIRCKGACLLIPGDATSMSWHDVVNRCESAGCELPRANVVVCWHHGGRLGRAQGTDWDDFVWSRLPIGSKGVAIVSCGAGNSFGHPSRSTIEASTRAGFRVACTERARPRSRASLSETARLQVDLLDVECSAEVYDVGRCHGTVVVRITDGVPVLSSGCAEENESECCWRLLDR